MSASFQDRSIPGGVVHNPASPYSREMIKWEMGPSLYGPNPGRPRERLTDREREWPALFYKVKRSSANGDFVVEHYQEAADEVEAARLEAVGYRNGQVAAIEYVKSLEQAVAVAAAERAYQDRNMSEKAKAEVAAVEAATAQHVAVIPETPIKRKRGRPRKELVMA